MDISFYTTLSFFPFPSFSLKPLIILCPDQELIDSKWKLKFPDAALTYVNSLKKAGADVMVLKGYEQNMEKMLPLMDGWLIPGGMDIDPRKYNAAIHPKTISLDSHDLRYNFELETYSKIPKSLPIFGVCYGSQLLNVLNGGSLIQHINNHEEHCGGKIRTVQLKKSSKLSNYVKDVQIKVKCYHHQAIEKKGVNVEPIVYDSDGTIHGIELNEPNRWVVGVQWHPERSEDEKNIAIIREFVRQAEIYKLLKILINYLIMMLTSVNYSKKKAQ